MQLDASKEWFKKAQEVLPGGVNSPVRAFKAVGGQPILMDKGEGPYIHDIDGNTYVDYVGSWGPLIVGHAHPKVVAALNAAVAKGSSFGTATVQEVELAKRVIQAVPSLEKVRFVNSGTEATMSALRLARGFTGRDKIIKFAGCYHGHADAFLSESAGSGVATLGIPGSAGVPKGAAQDTLTLNYNDLNQVDKCLERHGQDVAGIILEPVAGNMGLVKPADGFLEGLRHLCDKYDCLLIFDEVMTGFRLGLAGAQGHFDIRPDLSTFGKVIGGGLPVGAYGGRRDIMAHIAPEGGVYQAGTLSGNPLAMAAGIATMDLIMEPDFYTQLFAHTAALESGLNDLFAATGFAGRVYSIGSMFHLWLGEPETPAQNYEQTKAGDQELFQKLYQGLLSEGIYMAPSAFEVGFMSSAHTEVEVEKTVRAFKNSIAKL